MSSAHVWRGELIIRSPSLSLSLVLEVSGSRLVSSPNTSKDLRKYTCPTLLGETTFPWSRDLDLRSCDTGQSSLLEEAYTDE